MIKVKIKKLFPEIKLPTYAHPGDAGMDIYSREDVLLKAGSRYDFALGFKTEIPAGYVGIIFDRSSLAQKAGLHHLAGVIDAGYRGEWYVILQNLSNQEYQIKKGDKIAQILFLPITQVQLEEVVELRNSSRGEGGFGSTGK